ncbi:hypothetical protein LVJ94_45560 [Pendulispora rubella]|uniref:Holliday junction DNA helicase RuvA C-terminal domain-containing protein n=1 Tax=Pendulispora rubella TaxID=2741070 RepID=A0ABZ2KZR0_9BACT
MNPSLDQEHEVALRALTTMGFKEPQVRRVLAILEERWADRPPSIEMVVREAISVLT